MGKRIRVFSRTLALEAYEDDDNFAAMKSLNPTQVHQVFLAVMKLVQDCLEDDTTVVVEDFGTFRVKYPKAKQRRCRNVSTGEIEFHRIPPKVTFQSKFEVGLNGQEENDDEPRRTEAEETV